ncbi:MAG: glycoside hydrolase family 1 protein [Streptococcaceae bacterium]|jgi:6-phospho-beta-glucosidase|nr:glycoside hydrolase family 1 protein [Streptococcaceae bacterium]
MTLKIPKNFYWGNSSSSMQTEGAWNEGGKGPSVYDTDKAGRKAIDWKIAIDNYHDFDEDLDLMKAMNMNMYRFQISWSRVVPDGDGKFNEEGIQFYEHLVEELVKRGIEPMICLYHFDMPLALAEKYDGFLSREVKDAFVRYGKAMIDRFADKVKYWIVFNEHNLYFTPTAYHYAGIISHNELTDNEIYTTFHHTMLAHAELAAYIHETKDALIGGMLAYTQIYPATKLPLDNFLVHKVNEFNYWNLCLVYSFGHYSKEVMQEVINRRIDMGWQTGDEMILKKGGADFISFSYYRSHLLDGTKIDETSSAIRYLNQGFLLDDALPKNEWDWAIDAEGFRYSLTELYSRFRLPVFPIENGIGWREDWDGINEINDDYRINYHRDHIQALKDAMFIDGVEVLGYLGWGLIDIPASSGNIDKRYGVVYVDSIKHDQRDMKRVLKKSYHWFKKVLASNGDDLE